MKKIKQLFLLLLSINISTAVAQVTTNFNNENLISSNGTFAKNYATSVDLVMPAKNIESLIEKETQDRANSNETKPFRLAEPVSIDLDIAKQIKWTYDNDFAYGKYTISQTSALSSSINFDQFYLPTGTQLFVYNENGSMITGPVTEKENNVNKIWGSWVYKGGIINIEIKTPIASLSNLVLHANNIAYGYKEIYKSVKVGGYGNSGSCNINVICPLGNGWEGERNSVSTILDANGDEFCTGSLIMNTCGTDAPFYLTANHCFDGNAAGWRFAFQAWSTTCPNPGVNTNGVVYNGSTLRARNAATDFCLVELNTTPPTNSGLHYAGWSRSATPAQNVTAIHHPSGDLMKISRANNPVTISSYGSSTNQHWRANWSPQNNGAGATVTPITEPGSSGSPIFDQNHRIVGQLQGGPSFCNGSQLWDFYGRFDLSWNGGGTNATRLSNWLDPTNLSSVTTNTTNVANLNPANTNPVINGDLSICANSSRTYNLSFTPCSTTNTWTLTNSDGSSTIATVSPTTGSNTTVSVPSSITSGSLTLTATLSNGAIVTKNINVGSPYYGATYSNGRVSPLPVAYYFPPQGNNNNFNDVCIGSGFPNVYIDAQPIGATNVVWSVPTGYEDPAFSLMQQTGNRAYFRWNWGGTAHIKGYLQATINNSCGSSTNIFAFEQVNCGTQTDPCALTKNQKYFTVSPNPTSSFIKIGIGNKPPPYECPLMKSMTTSKGIIFSRVNVYDRQGSHLKSMQQKDAKSATVGLDNLIAGSYTVEIISGDYKESHQIIVQK